MYVCCLWGGGKVPISANRNTSGPQPRWLRRCTNILEIHQTRKTNRNAPRKLETHHQSPHQSSIHGCKKTKSIDCKSFALPPLKNRIFQPLFKLWLLSPFKISASHCFRARTCCYSLCSNKLLLIISRIVFWQSDEPNCVLTRLKNCHKWPLAKNCCQRIVFTRRALLQFVCFEQHL